VAFPDLGAVRAAVQSKLIFLREPTAPYVDDVVLLRDVADAFKHHKLDRPNATVDGADAIIMTGTGWGKLRWDEGKWGGGDLVDAFRDVCLAEPNKTVRDAAVGVVAKFRMEIAGKLIYEEQQKQKKK
jgi:hypothetical protein